MASECLISLRLAFDYKPLGFEQYYLEPRARHRPTTCTSPKRTFAALGGAR